MIPLNAQGNNTSQAVFGIHGNEVPGFPLESTPGDAVFFDHYLFHAVYDKSESRRYIALKYAYRPTGKEHFESLERHHQGATNLHQTVLNCSHPRMRQLISPLLTGHT